MTPCRSARSTRDTIRQCEDHQRQLIVALFDSEEPVRHDLANRLLKCQQVRAARRSWYDLHDEPTSINPHRCKLVACYACRRSIARRWEDEARRRLFAAEMTDCSIVRVVLARTIQVEMIRHIVRKARKDLGNLRAGLYRQRGGWRWHSVQAFGMVEADAVAIRDMALLPPDRLALLQSLPSLASGGSRFWLSHLNLVVHHPHLDRAELARHITHQWPSPGRVNVRPFKQHQFAPDNAADIDNCSLQQFEQITVRADYHSWLFAMKRGLQPLGISLRPRQERCLLVARDVEGHSEQGFLPASKWHGSEIEPMPVVIG